MVGARVAAKGGLKMLTRNMATEWAKYNIQVNGIGPGYFATAQTALQGQTDTPSMNL
ncbi:MAG: SDR family NAD(P)-dependent oxidoreductase [Flavobacteriaceae bacterium]